VITSTHNPRIAAVRKLQRTKERRAAGLTTIEGPFLLEEALTGDAVIREVFVTPDDVVAAFLNDTATTEIYTVSPAVLSSLAGSVSPRGPIAVISVPPSAELDRADTVVLWEISDPGNAGTIIRTAAALGFQVAVTAGSVDVWSPKVVRSAVGGHFRTKLVTGFDNDIAALVNGGLLPLVASAGATDPAETSLGSAAPIALLVGNEAHGVPTEIAGEADVSSVSLAMPGGSESLNAAVAAGILMYLRMLQRS
jgi:TrmH family RNA methyltransferase